MITTKYIVQARGEESIECAYSLRQTYYSGKMVLQFFKCLLSGIESSNHLALELFVLEYCTSNNTAKYRSTVNADTLGAGLKSVVERSSLSRRLASKSHPSILRSLIG